MLIRKNRHDIVSGDMYLSGLVLAGHLRDVTLPVLSLALISVAFLVSKARIVARLSGLDNILSGSFRGHAVG